MKWDANNVCLTCSARFYFNDKNVCTPVSDQCYTWNSNGECASCYGGYVLNGKECIVNPTPFTPSKDSLCRKWSSEVCLECSERSYFDQKGVCQGVSDNCNTWDKRSGDCFTCFKGYDLKDGKCTFSSFNNAKPSDSGCGKWDWDNQVCLQCSNGWVFNSNKVCVPVDSYCNSYNSNGDCTSCFPGYLLSAGKCVLTNPLCKSSGSNGSCLSCFTGYILFNQTCTPISKLASLYLYYAECCPEKLATLPKQKK